MSAARCARAIWAVLALTAAPAAAQEEARGLPAAVRGERAPWVIVYDHATDVVRLHEPDGTEVERWSRREARGELPLLTVPTDRPVQVVVENANALLYDYDASWADVRESDVTPCREMGGLFLSRGFLMSVGSMGGEIAGDLASVQEYLATSLSAEELVAAARGQNRQMDRNDLARVLTSVQRPVGEYLAFSESAERLVRTLPDSLRRAARFAEARSSDSLLADLQERIARAIPGLDGPEDVPSVFEQRQVAVGGFASALVDASVTVADGRYTGESSDREVAEVKGLSDALLEALARSDSLAVALQLELLAIERARAGSRQVFTLPPSRNYRSISLELQPTDDDRFAAVPRLREGVTVYTQPRAGLRCDVSIGMAWMDRVPEYDEDADEVRRTAESSDDRTTASLLLHVSHPSFPALGLLGGVGVGSQGSPDFYLGGSFRYFAPVLLNAGWVWQKTPRLPAGLRVGDPVPSPGALSDLPRSLRSGLFFGVSLAR